MSSKVNTMTLAFAKQLGFQVWKTDKKAQKIGSSLLKTLEIIITGF